MNNNGIKMLCSLQKKTDKETNDVNNTFLLKKYDVQQFSIFCAQKKINRGYKH